LIILGKYTAENLWKSDLAINVLKEIKTSEEGSYSTRIADNLNKEQSSVSRLISALEERNIVEKGKRTKAQYYEVTDKGSEFLELMQEKESIQNNLKEMVSLDK
jgi:predicted transcriptional regulator